MEAAAEAVATREDIDNDTDIIHRPGRNGSDIWRGGIRPTTVRYSRSGRKRGDRRRREARCSGTRRPVRSAGKREPDLGKYLAGPNRTDRVRKARSRETPPDRGSDEFEPRDPFDWRRGLAVPVPIVRTNGKWAFDPAAAKVEMEARRIGTHELDALEICAGYVDAQRRFASEDRDKDGMLHYAAHMTSGQDGKNGLFRQNVDQPLVPEGLAQAAWEGQKRSAKPYHGYYFRILEGQGPNAPGGAHSYVVKGKLMGGFGLVAWPAEYGVTGIHTFIVNQDGVIYQKDIAPSPAGGGSAVTRYDPDPTWTTSD